MKKFNILYDQGLWNHIIVGFDDGTWEILPPEKMNNSQWLSENRDKTIKVSRTNFPPPVYGATTYDIGGLSRAPRPLLRVFRAFRVQNRSYDVKFLADYIAEDRTWFVVGDRPDTSLSPDAL